MEDPLIGEEVEPQKMMQSVDDVKMLQLGGDLDQPVTEPEPPIQDEIPVQEEPPVQVNIEDKKSSGKNKKSSTAVKTQSVMVRARVTRLTPEQPASIAWRRGGEGLGGDPVRGNLTTEKPPPPPTPGTGAIGFGPEDRAMDDKIADLKEDLENDPAKLDRVVVEGKTTDKVFLLPGVWSKALPISTFRGGQFLTFEVQGMKSRVTHTELEFEFLYNGELLKRFVASGAQGNTIGVRVPARFINKDGSPQPKFVEKLGSLKHYVYEKLKVLKEMPGMDRPVPKLYAISTDCYGFGEIGGYAIRTSDPETFLAEFEILRWIGMNGTAGIPAFFAKQRKNKQGIPAEFSRLQRSNCDSGPLMKGVTRVSDGQGGKKLAPKPGEGCPYYPPSVSNRLANVGAQIEKSFEARSNIGVDQIWEITIDEIGSIFDGAPEGKAHQGSCPYCRKAFHEFVRSEGRTLADFGATSWEDVRSNYGYWSLTYAESLKKLTAARDKAQAAVDAKLKQELAATRGKAFGDPSADKSFQLLDDAMATDTSKGKTKGEAQGKTQNTSQNSDAFLELKAAQKRLDDLETSRRVLEVPLTNRVNRLSREGQMLNWYYSGRFNCESTARVFEPVRNAYDAINERKRAALARGETDTPAAKQPWAYSYGLRANTFLLSGHSLDFFNFYRHADNAFVYETSNRDWRIWQWDSYLCDVGRSLNRFMNKQFGLYVKAHRGAPIQRCLAAVARGVRMIYWYTYGPEYVKGDSFGGSTNLLKEIAWVNRIIAGGEEVTYDSDWAVPAEVAVVRPLTSEYMSGSASYENAKWVYTALMHAHIPMDALDEGLLITEDITRYKVIVISGCHIRRDVAMKLAKWVEAGGTLVTSGWGMARDESDRPLEIMWPVFGLANRGKFDAWGGVPGYGATRLGAVRKMKDKDPPEGAMVTGKGLLKGSFMPVVGREVLDPKQGDEVMATYADGKAAVVRHRYGKGTAWLIGTYAGVEYAWEPMINTNEDQKWFRADKRSWIAGPILEAGVRPVVDAEGYYGMWEDSALVEGHMLRNRKTGALAVILINWTHHIRKPVTIKIREAGNMKTAKSVATGETFPLERKSDLMVATMPKLDEGDILLLTP